MKPVNFPLLLASQISCIRGERRLFNKLDFSLASGELLQVVGPNGVGKTSLLRIVAGLLAPDFGKLSCRVDSFYLGHQLGLKETFTVEENLIFDMRYPKPRFSEIESLLNEVNLSQFLSQKTELLSQGQRQRVALTKCLLSPALLWILDEPLVALDIASREFWQRKISDHLNRGGAVMISSHLPLSLSPNIYKKLELNPC